MFCFGQHFIILFFFFSWQNQISCSLLFLLECLFYTCVSRQSHRMSDIRVFTPKPSQCLKFRTWILAGLILKGANHFSMAKMGLTQRGSMTLILPTDQNRKSFKKNTHTIVHMILFFPGGPLLLSVSVQLNRPLQIHCDGGGECMCSLCSC